jgi:hypothetical protein
MEENSHMFETNLGRNPCTYCKTMVKKDSDVETLVVVYAAPPWNQFMFKYLHRH